MQVFFYDPKSKDHNNLQLLQQEFIAFIISIYNLLRVVSNSFVVSNENETNWKLQLITSCNKLFLFQQHFILHSSYNRIVCTDKL